MAKSKVFFTTMRTVGEENICDKLVRLCRTAGVESIDFKDKFTAIKVHFGEEGNLAFLRPDYARAIANLIRSLGGKPFRRKKIFNFMILYLCPIFAAIILVSSVANALGWIAM